MLNFLRKKTPNLACLSDPWDLVPEILSRIKEPQIPNRTFNIDAYGAVRSTNSSSEEEPTSTVDANIRAFEDAIQAAHDAGGGTVQVPAGTYMTSAITLKSNVALEVTAGAVIRFTRDTTKYKNVYTRWEGVELWNYSPFIYAFEAENIAIKGKMLQVRSIVNLSENNCILKEVELLMVIVTVSIGGLGKDIGLTSIECVGIQTERIKIMIGIIFFKWQRRGFQ